MTKALFLVSLLAACGGQTIGGGGDAAIETGTSQPCTSSAQCGQGMCGFAETQGCAAVGHCFPPSGAVCNGFQPGCSCAGDTINLICNGLPAGYTTAQFGHAGSCNGGNFPCVQTTCIEGQDICYISATPGPPPFGSCMPANGCTDCACAQAMFQCLSSCTQDGGAITIECQ